MKAVNVVSTALISLTGLCLSAPLLAASLEMGRWQTTHEMQSPMGGFSQPPEVVCIDREVDPEQEMLEGLSEEQNCQVTHREQRSGTLYFTILCSEEGVQVTQHGTMTYDDDSYAMDLEIITDVADQPMMSQQAGPDGKIHAQMKMRGRRLGDCDGSEPKFDEQREVEPAITFTPGADGNPDNPLAQCMQLGMEMSECVNSAMGAGSQAAMQARMQECQRLYEPRMQACEQLGR